MVTYAWGDGARPVLLVHGWSARASRFATLVEALLAAGRSPVAYDAWGHGASRGPARTVLEHEAVITELAERHGAFEGAVGHSFGVPVTLYAARHGLAADRLVAISGMGDFGHLTDTFCRRLGAGPVVDRELRHAIERRWFAGDDAIWSRFSVQRAPAATCSSCTTPTTGWSSGRRPTWSPRRTASAPRCSRRPGWATPGSSATRTSWRRPWGS